MSFVKEWENFKHALAEHFVASQTRDPLHRAVPRDQSQFTVEREDTVDAGVDKSA